MSILDRVFKGGSVLRSCLPVYALRAGRATAAFTLVELLVAVGIVAVLGTAAAVAMDPSELMKRSRDATRIADLDALNKALALYEADGNVFSFTPNTIYLSLPDANANCSSYSLPPLPGGWSYACRPLANYREITGGGWVPVDLTLVSSGAPIATLPADPVSDAARRLYYAYVPGGSWELNAALEAQANILAGGSDKVSTDGGDDFTKYEVGNDLVIAPWSFEFKYFPLAAHNSGQPGWYKSSGAGTMTTMSDATSPHFVQANGYVWYNWQENIPFNPDSTYKATCTARQVTDPTTGGKSIYCGWVGVTADGTTLTNVTGVNSYSSQHYHTMAGTQLTAVGAEGPWTSYTGYTKGWGSPNGSGGTCSSAGSPCRMQANTRYLRPMFIMNYSNGNGIADLDSIVLTKY